MPTSPIPDIQIIPVRAKLSASTASLSVFPENGTIINLQEKRIEEFLQARSLALKSQRAYQQDLQRFLNWTEQSWAEITPRQVALFKRHLMRSDPETNKRILSDPTVNRTLGTLKNFYGCSVRRKPHFMKLFRRTISLAFRTL